MIFFVPFFFMSFLRLPTVQPVYPTPYTYPPPCWAPTKVWLRAFFAGCHRDALPDTCADLWCGTLACHPGCIWTRSVIPHIDDRCLENCWARGRESIVHYNIFDYINLTVYYLHLSFICIFAFARMTYISLHQGRKCEIIRLTPTQCTKRGNSLSFVDI